MFINQFLRLKTVLHKKKVMDNETKLKISFKLRFLFEILIMLEH